MTVLFRRAAAVSAAMVLASGCATTGTQAQAECEKAHQLIGEIVACTKQTLAEKNPAKLRDAKAKLYLLRGDQLADDVAAGRMGNSEARVAWQRLYLELWTDTQAQDVGRALMLQAAQPPAPPTYKIVQPPVSTVCTTSPFLGQLRTECTSR